MIFTPEMNKKIPFYSDVDGTLINSDLLIEAILIILKRQPWNIFTLLFWLLKGKAFLKARIADTVNLDPSLLPYNTEFVEFLQAESKLGREIYLASASEERHVSAIASYLGFIRGVVATAHGQNLKGKVKLKAIRAHCGEQDFAYAGDSRADLSVWEGATEGILVNTSAFVEKRARGVTSVTHIFPVSRPGFLTYLKAVRLHQWLKNLLVFVPLLLAHSWNDLEAVMATIAVFFGFGLMASGTYIVNDLLDLSSDRRHPSKQRRPIAAGQIPLATAVTIACGLVSLSIIFMSMVSIQAVLILCFYCITTLAYSFYLKTVMLVDVLVLAGLYTIRIIAGSVVINQIPSPWLLAFSGFLFLSLALLKRCVELEQILQLNELSTSGRDYRVCDFLQLVSMGIASAFSAVLVIALYINTSTAHLNYQTPEFLWLICPLLLYWINRMWIKAARHEMHDDPIVYSVKDRTTWLIFLAMFVVWLVAYKAYITP